MSILIKGMEMPFDGSFATIMILPDGTMQTRRGDPLPYTAVPIPPHGRLIEESRVLDIVYEWCPDDDGSVGKDGDLRKMLDEIEALPTIIEAEEE